MVNKNKISLKDYKDELRRLQIELVKLQRYVIKNDLQLLIIFEGRDAAGKDGVIKRITEHLSPRDTRVVALGKPSDRDRESWYFQRYVFYLPSKQEIVVMNRSWYNRAGVEKIMGFCSDKEYEDFMNTVPTFEHMLAKSGIKFFKYYLDITKEEQAQRLKEREEDPLQHWKSSPIDAAAQKHWRDYSKARDEMLRRTHNADAPWYVVRADNKKLARLNVIRHLLAHIDWPEKNLNFLRYDKDIVFKFDETDERLKQLIAP